MLSERIQSYVIIYDSVHKEGQNKEISRHRKEVCGCIGLAEGNENGGAVGGE